MDIIRPFSRAATDLLFPRRCAACQQDARSLAALLCVPCHKTLASERTEPACPRCGRAVAPFEVLDGTCRECRRHPPRVVGTVRTGPYGKCLGRLVRAYKYRGREELGRMLADWLAEATRAAPWLARIDAITGVPTHWRHRLRRPLHAAEALAMYVARRVMVPNVALLRRVRAGPHQVGLSYAERVTNVRGAFALRPKVILNGPRILLIDDVRTTGATINECARVLLRGGAAEVYAGVVANVGWTPGGALGMLNTM